MSVEQYFFKHKELFRSIWSVIFCKNIFMIWFSYMGANFSVTIFNIFFLIKVGQDEIKSPEINESSDKRRKMHKWNIWSYMGDYTIYLKETIENFRKSLQ